MYAASVMHMSAAAERGVTQLLQRWHGEDLGLTVEETAEDAPVVAWIADL